MHMELDMYVVSLQLLSALVFLWWSLWLNLERSSLSRLAGQQAPRLISTGAVLGVCCHAQFLIWVLRRLAQDLMPVPTVLDPMNHLPGYNYFLRCTALSYSFFILLKQISTCLVVAHHNSPVVCFHSSYIICNACWLLLGIEFTISDRRWMTILIFQTVKLQRKSGTGAIFVLYLCPSMLLMSPLSFTSQFQKWRNASCHLQLSCNNKFLFPPHLIKNLIFPLRNEYTFIVERNHKIKKTLKYSILYNTLFLFILIFYLY